MFRKVTEIFSVIVPDFAACFVFPVYRGNVHHMKIKEPVKKIAL